MAVVKTYPIFGDGFSGVDSCNLIAQLKLHLPPQPPPLPKSSRCSEDLCVQVVDLQRTDPAKTAQSAKTG